MNPSAPRPILGYVCGALRVSTHNDADSIGPRAHVVGFLNGLRASSVEVRQWLAGDEIRARGHVIASDAAMRGGRSRRILTDVARLGFRYEARRRARACLGNVDVLYERQATFQDVGRAFRARGVPWVIESNGPFWYEASKERNSLALVERARKLEVAAYRDADLVVVVSDDLRDILKKETGRSSDDFLVLPNATDAVRFDPQRVTPVRRFAGLTIGFVGYLAEWAGVDLLIEAMAELRNTGQSLHATIVGDGPARVYLEALAEQVGVADRVDFLGRVPWSDVPSLLAGLDLAYSGQRAMAIGSMYHSPQKLYEYRAMGLQVVAADHADARRLINDGIDGFVFDSGDVAGLVRSLRLAIANSDRRSEAFGIRAGLLAEHTWEVRVQTLLANLVQRGLLASAEDRPRR